MAIKDLTPKQGNVDVTVDAIEKGDIREFQKFGKAGRVCNAKVRDESGEIALTLWNEDIDKVNVGDKLKITNGYVSEWQGELQLSTGRYGKMEIVGKAATEEDALKELDEKQQVSEEPVQDDGE